MKTALLITTFNRPDYLRRCLASVKRAGIKDVLIVDDCSTDKETLELLKHCDYKFYCSPRRRGICNSLIVGIDTLFSPMGYDIVINIDADAIIRNDYMERMLELHNDFPDDIITGFHSTTKNKDGSERHVDN
jgi:glycosyltransferase involved in cell wall biosynthesis